MRGPFGTRSWHDSPTFEFPFIGFDCVQDLELTDDRDYTVDKPGRGRLYNVLDARNDHGYYDPCIGMLEIQEHDYSTYTWLNDVMKSRRSGCLEGKATLVFFGEKMMRRYDDETSPTTYNHHTLDMLCCLSVLASREFQSLSWEAQKWQLARIHCSVHEIGERFSLTSVSALINQHIEEGCSDEGEHLSCLIVCCRDGSFLVDTGMSLDELSQQVEKFMLSGYSYSRYIVDVTNYTTRRPEPVTPYESRVSRTQA